jgi:hypothetical protein
MRILLTLTTLLLTILTSSNGFACKNISLEYYLQMSSHELKKHHCTRNQLILEVANQQNNFDQVIFLGKKLRNNNIFDQNSLRSEAFALFSVKRYQDALTIFLQSKSALTICQIASSNCGRNETSNAIDHYEYYKYFCAAGINDKAAIELKLADIEFSKLCPLSGDGKTRCQMIRNGLLKMLGLTKELYCLK